MSVFDPGLQPERSALAWQRTALAVAVGALVLARILAPSFGMFALGPALVGLAVAGYIATRAKRRYYHHHKILVAHGDRVRLADGALPAVLSLSVVLGGATALLIAVTTGFK